MTRRVRFTPFLVRGLFVAAGALAMPGAARAGDVPFQTQPPVYVAGGNALSVAAADMDGDGDLDAISTFAGTSGLAWHENTSGDGTAWTVRTIETGVLITSARVADVDGDGDPDVVAAAGFDDWVGWYENTAGNGTAWTARTISTVPDGPQSVNAADVDGDGDLDVLSASLFDDTVAWYENVGGTGTAWTPRTVSGSAWGGQAVAAADVDGDGDADVISGSVNDDKVAWYENLAGNGTTWATHTVTTAADGLWSVAVGDVDGDGDVDLLSASRFDDKIAWYENVAGNGTSWAPRTLSTAAVGALSVFAADLDQDGDLDVVSASTSDDKLAWYENVAGDGSVWTARTISTLAAGARSAFVADMDGDGDPDVLSASSDDFSVRWYRNQSIHSAACLSGVSPIATSLDISRSVYAADVDGDGDTDVLAATFNDDTVAWHENAAGNGTVWTERVISTAVDNAFSVASADVDGDGDLDVVAGSRAIAGAVVWFENSAGNGSTWAGHTVAASDGLWQAFVADVDRDGDPDVVSADDVLAWHENLGGGSAWATHTIAPLALFTSAVAADVDGDGDLDVLSTSTADGRVAWWENTLGDGSAWSGHTVALADHPFTLVAADVDGDGDLDTVVGTDSDVVTNTLIWHENTAGDGSAWLPHTIGSPPARVFYGVSTADVDGDGDLDVVSATYSFPVSGAVYWHENTAGNGSAWQTRTIHSGLGAFAVTTADLDRDGDVDVVSTSVQDGNVGWHPNRGGQFSLTAGDMAPASAVDGQLVPLLRVEAAHLGRPGDGDLELARFGLLLEESAGDPLTTAEANALIESLRVYRDANANAVFDPADVLVAGVATLSLANGVQTVSLADGDPDVQVGLSTPRTYLVVAELKPTASAQAPNRFRATHLGLGPSASAAEDRTYDTPLRPSCPADVASSIVVATPPPAGARVTGSMTVAGAFAEGGAVTYATVLSNGGSLAQGDNFEDEFVDLAPSSLAVTAADDGGDPGTIGVVGNLVTWNGAIPAGGSLTIAIQATVGAGTAGSMISNQATLAFDADGSGSNESRGVSDDPRLPGSTDPTSFVVGPGVAGDLVHGSRRVLDLAPLPGPLPDRDLFRLYQEPAASYEVIVDAATGDLGPGPALDRLSPDGATVLQSSVPAGTGASRSLRFENPGPAAIGDQLIRVGAGGCGTSCTSEDSYGIRAYETTLALSRFNNSGSQVTVLVLQNPTAGAVSGSVWLWSSEGSLAGSVPFALAPHATFVLNTSFVPGAGSITVSHDAPYGSLTGKTVALEPATGFTFDTPLVARRPAP